MLDLSSRSSINYKFKIKRAFKPSFLIFLLNPINFLSTVRCFANLGVGGFDFLQIFSHHRHFGQQPRAIHQSGATQDVVQPHAFHCPTGREVHENSFPVFFIVMPLSVVNGCVWKIMDFHIDTLKARALSVKGVPRESYFFNYLTLYWLLFRNFHGQRKCSRICSSRSGGVFLPLE